MEKTFQVKTSTTALKAITSSLLKSIQYENSKLQNIARTRGWTVAEFYPNKILQTLRENEIKNIQRKNWKKLNNNHTPRNSVEKSSN